MSQGNGKVGSVLVVGGGIGGVQAALDLAESGYYVYLLEKSPSIGGVMAQLDKTFPTNDCSMCILSPKLVEAASHPNIALYAYSEVEDIQGEPGRFRVKIRRKAPYVDWSKCTGCGVCSEWCPVVKPSEFNQGLDSRRAIYTSFPQAVPKKMTRIAHPKILAVMFPLARLLMVQFLSISFFALKQKRWRLAR